MNSAGLPDIIAFTFNYIATIDGTQPTGFSSKHGQDEVRGDFYELCVERINREKLWDFVYCNNFDFGGYTNIPNDVQSCATQTGVSWTDLSSCYTSYSTPLLDASIDATNAAGAQFSPTVFVQNQCIYGGLASCTNLDPTTADIRNYICSKYNGTKPSGCT